MSTMAFSSPLTAGSPMIPPPNRQLGRNPLLPPTPQSGELDSTYMAEEAVLRANVARQYADILQQLGFVDEQGNFIPGQVSVQAGRQLSDLGRASDLAEEEVTENAQRQGTLFSGRRAQDTARAQFPYQQQIARLNTDIPLQLGGLYESAAGLMDQYTLQNNLLLADMARRRAAAAAAAGGGVAGPPPGAGGGEGGGQGGGQGGERPLTPADLGTIAGGMFGGGPLAGTPIAPKPQPKLPVSTGGKTTKSGGKTYYQSFKGPYGYKPQY